MSSAFRRQYQKELQQAREAAVHRRTELVSQLGEDRREDAWLLIQDKHEELHGSGFYSIGQIEEVNAIIAAYTPDEFDAAVALAKSRESAV
jgi:aspartate/tyrosine/aromatic aminotransferase